MIITPVIQPNFIEVDDFNASGRERVVLATPGHINECNKPNDFRAYDIRGTHPDQLNSKMVETLGQALELMPSIKVRRLS